LIFSFFNCSALGSSQVKGTDRLRSGLHVHRAAPDEAEVAEHFLRLGQVDIQAAVLVGEVQLAAVAVVAVHHVHERLPHVREAVQERLLDALKVAADDLQFPLCGSRRYWYILWRSTNSGVRNSSMNCTSL